MSKHDPIYITGVGVISPLGITRSEQWQGYGRCDSHFSLRDYGGIQTPVACLSSIGDSALAKLREEKTAYKNLDRTALMAIYAARQIRELPAWHGVDSGIGIMIGSSRGATELLEDSVKKFIEEGEQALAVATSPLTTLGNISSWVAQDLGSVELAISHSVTCSTAHHAIGNAIAWLRAGMLTQVIVGGAEAPLTPFTIAQMRALRIYGEANEDSAEKLYPCMPFGEGEKNSLVLGEGAALLGLTARAPDEKNCFGKIVGFGAALEKIPSPTGISKQGDGVRLAMERACRDADLTPEQIDSIIMHAPGTRGGDRAELCAIKGLFGDTLPYLHAPKWIFGHTFGASGTFGIDIALFLLQGGSLPLPPYRCTLKQSRDLRTPTYCMVNTAGFGGNAVSIILSR
jgi:3-oxoacyl-[acyl-carrier-protein] synthase II